MAAGLGFKDFTTGEVLTAADVDGYLMQGIWVFASEAARNAAVTSPQEGNFAFTKDTNSLWYYTGSAWAASGATGDIEGVTAGTGISGGGTSGTVTITNDMATTITAAGDIVVGTGSGTYDNLPIGTTGQILTADTTVSPYKVKWAAASAASFAGVQLTASSSGQQTIANNTFVKLTWDVENYDVGGYASAGDTITIPSGKSGYYLVIARGYWDTNTSGTRHIAIYKNGTRTYQNNVTPAGTSVYPTSMIQAVFYAAETDTIEAYVKQTSGGSLSIYKSQTNDEGGSLSAAFLGA